MRIPEWQLHLFESGMDSIEIDLIDAAVTIQEIKKDIIKSGRWQEYKKACRQRGIKRPSANFGISRTFAKFAEEERK